LQGFEEDLYCVTISELDKAKSFYIYCELNSMAPIQKYSNNSQQEILAKAKQDYKQFSTDYDLWQKIMYDIGYYENYLYAVDPCGQDYSMLLRILKELHGLAVELSKRK
jgi:hypothetical protein